MGEEGAETELLLNPDHSTINAAIAWGTGTSEDIPDKSIASDKQSTPSSHKRLLSLDAVRGLTVVLMILVDDAGTAYPHIDHSPWDNVTLADFVMPWFLFMVGMAMALSFKKFENGKGELLAKICSRTVKLFLLGLILQGGGFPNIHTYTFGYNLKTIRWAGILQRIAFAYFVVSTIEVFVPVVGKQQAGRSESTWKAGLDIFMKSSLKWGAVLSFMVLYMLLMLFTYVPSWYSVISKRTNTAPSTDLLVNCDVRGSFGPACNAAGYWDRLILGVHHLYQPGEKIRLPECSSCSPGLCPLPASVIPTWCYAPFDPEGIVASFNTVVTTYIGLHFGHVLKYCHTTKDRLLHWTTFSLFLIAIGTVINFTIIPFNKQLWTPSYVFMTAGCCGLLLVLSYLLIDVYNLYKPFAPLVWVGMNPLLVFIMGAADVLDSIIGSVYISSVRDGATTTTNLVDYFQTSFLHEQLNFSQDVAVLAFTLTKISFWLVASGVLYSFRYFWKV